MSQEYKDPMRKNPTRLNNDQKYTIYTYAMENRCVFQNGEEMTFRVAPSQIAKELNLLRKVGVEINSHHVQEAVSMTISWQKRLMRLPSIPKEEIEHEKLKLDYAAIVKQLEVIKIQLAQEQAKATADGVASLKLSKIKAILAA